jgi:MFS family permease
MPGPGPRDSIGLAASVLYLGAVGDRYGRKLLLVLGTVLSVPACLLAAFASSVEVLVLARLVGGLAAGTAFPTTLALITALWSGPARTRSIALWSGLGGAISSLGPLLSGWLLESFWWGSVFLITLPPAVSPCSWRRPGARPRQRGHRPGRPSRRRPLGAAGGRAGPGDQLRGRPQRRRPDPRPGRGRGGRRDRLPPPPAPGAQPAVRPPGGRPPCLLGGGLRRPGRVRLTGSVPVWRAGMASGTADLQRDLGGAIMQSILGALLTAGFVAAMAGAVAGSPEPTRSAPASRPSSRSRSPAPRPSPSSTRSTPARSPPPPRRGSWTGPTGPTPPGIVAILVGAALVFFLFPRQRQEEELLRRYHAEDTAKVS